MSSDQLNLISAFDDAEWPPQERFPLNEMGRRVEPHACRLTDPGSKAIVATGYSSLDYLIRAFGDGRRRNVDLILGNEPAASVASRHPRVSLPEEIREFWLERGLSILDGSAVAALIDAIRRREVRIHLYDGLHAKVVVGSEGAMLGSSNFSYGGLRRQHEANVRFELGSADYKHVQRIAENFLRASRPFDDDLVSLLEDLLKPCTWSEALARAAAELLEGTWLRRYTDVLSGISESSLWPSQRQAIAQALYILDTNGSVLIADPTGSGKTRLGLHLVLALINRLYRTGRGHRTNAITVCPPLIRDDWRGEIRGGGTLAVKTLSHGVLSSRGRRKKEALEDLRLANILVVDEAHNYLNHLSARSRSIRSAFTDHVILLTATPINRGPQDLLRLIEILGVDNLTDSQYGEYERLRKLRRSLTRGQQHALRDYIRDFTIRRTKTDLNKLIEREPEAYVDAGGRPCRYPTHTAKVFSTGESENDKRIAYKINALACELKGLLYLRTIRESSSFQPGAESQQKQLEGTLRAAAALARYNVLATMRSSKVALVEHVHGTERALADFGLSPNVKGETGDVVGTLSGLRFEDLRYELSVPRPDFLTSDGYAKALLHETEIYCAIAQKAIRLSNSRDIARIQLLERLLEKHDLVLAFDSRVITIEYLQQRIGERGRFEAIAVHGSTSYAKARARELLGHGSRERGWAALCSDAMSEGVNLQGASAVVLLDMPGVIRLAEQRIGRVDRMNSKHEAIEVYWPDDSEPFQLTTSQKFVQRYDIVKRVIGVNMPLPSELRDGTEERFHVKTIINLYEERQKEIEDRGFLQDAFLPVRNLRDALIPEDVYEAYKNVRATVQSRVSFVGASEPWAFFALRGTETRAPQWLLINSSDGEERDLRKICDLLMQHLSESEQLPWNAAGLERMLNRLVLAEHRLLPQRRRRALKLLSEALSDWRKDMTLADSPAAETLRMWLLPFNTQSVSADSHRSESVDYYQLAGLFLDVMERYYEKAQERRRRRPVRLRDLRPYLRAEPLPADVLTGFVAGTQLLPPIERRIAACIVGVPEET